MHKKKLQSEDGNAVDLILDGQNISLTDSGRFAGVIDVEPQRVQSVKHVLDLLRQCPAEEPAPDLARRTIRRIDAREALDRSSILRAADHDDRPSA
jgi:hypothetical protein